MNDERMETRVLRALATAAGYRGVLGAPNMRTVGWNWRLRNEFAAGHRDELLRWGSSLSEDEFLRIRNLHRKSWDWLQSHRPAPLLGEHPAETGAQS